MIHDNVLGKRCAVLYLHKILRKCVKEKYKCLARVVQFSLFNPDVVGRLPSVDKLLSACWASQSGSLPSMQGQLASLSSHSQNLACLSFWCIGNSGLLQLLQRKHCMQSIFSINLSVLAIQLISYVGKRT